MILDYISILLSSTPFFHTLRPIGVIVQTFRRPTFGYSIYVGNNLVFWSVKCLPTSIYCDNVNVVYLSSSSIQHHRTKHIKMDIHFTCEKVIHDQILNLHALSQYQIVDILTKGLPLYLFDYFQDNLISPSSRFKSRYIRDWIYIFL